QYTVVFDDSSMPTITYLTGTVFALAIVPVRPTLTVTQAVNSVTISWPATTGYTLQRNSNLAAAAGWATSSYTISTANGTNSITVAPPKGNLFFRLANP